MVRGEQNSDDVKTILVVDDIDTNRKLLRQMLQMMQGFNVIEAHDGAEAITLFECGSPDLILMDVNMPKMNGYESASAIKLLADNNYIPIIFVTALTAEASLAHALASGGDDFISKPFNAEVLESKIRAHLRIRELNQELNYKNRELTSINKYLTHEQELIEHFFESALQQSFLDPEFIQYHMSSMSTFNGDLLLVARGMDGSLYLIMGDFTGHGLSAAMGTLPVAMIFFKMTCKNLAVGDIAREINRQLHKFMPSGMFFSASILEINARGDRMSVWMGGMPESYWLSDSSQLKGEICSRHMPLGIQKDSDFDAAIEVFNVNRGDKVYLYSDGISEARNPDGEMFGNNRLKEILLLYSDDVIHNILNELKTFTATDDQHDDITLVELTCNEMPAIAQHEQNNVDGFFLPWKMSTSFSAVEMRDDAVITKLLDMLCAVPVLGKHRGVLHILLSEIYSNILDHGILEMDSNKKKNADQFENYYRERECKLQVLKDAFIDFDFNLCIKRDRQYLQMQIKDSGRGYKGHTSNDSELLAHGRGMKIIQGLSESVQFSDDGRTLDVLFLL